VRNFFASRSAKTTLVATVFVLALQGVATLNFETDAVADAQTEQPDDNASHWVTANVPGTSITVQHPGTWTEVPRDRIQAIVGEAATVLLAVVEVSVTGDNVEVNQYEGKSAYWYSGLAAYKKEARQSAESSHGKLLSVAKAKIGGQRAYRHVETYVDSQSKKRVIYGQFDIRQSSNSVINVVVNVRADTPDARQIVDTILDSVAA